jgi:hypothetical protein
MSRDIIQLKATTSAQVASNSDTYSKSVHSEALPTSVQGTMASRKSVIEGIFSIITNSLTVKNLSMVSQTHVSSAKLDTTDPVEPKIVPGKSMAHLGQIL